MAGGFDTIRNHVHLYHQFTILDGLHMVKSETEFASRGMGER